LFIRHQTFNFPVQIRIFIFGGFSTQSRLTNSVYLSRHPNRIEAMS